MTIVALMTASVVRADEHFYMNWDGQQREYLLHVPSTYNASRPTALLFFLHGIYGDIDFYGSQSQLTQLAEMSGWIIAVPQALSYKAQLGKLSVPLGACWNVGMVVNFNNATDTLNKDVDDEGFLLALTDTLKCHYNIDNDSVFLTGFSMGGFMTHTMMIRHGNVYSGAVAASGTIANILENEQPAYPNIHHRLMHIHSPSDPVVTWDGNFLSLSLNVDHVGTSVDSCISYWRSFNQCSATEVTDTFPDRKDDGLLFVRHSYNNGIDSSRVVLVEVQEGTHYWYDDATKYDISYNVEIYNFLADKNIDYSLLTTVDDVVSSSATLYPNPATEIVFLNVDYDCEAIISDINGRVIMRQQCEAGVNTITVGGLPKGIYIVRIGNGVPAKLIIQ